MNHCASIIFKSITSESIFFLASFSTGANIGSEKISNNNKKHTHTQVWTGGVLPCNRCDLLHMENMCWLDISQTVLSYIYIYIYIYIHTHIYIW